MHKKYHFAALFEPPGLEEMMAKTLEDILNSLFGDKETLTKAELTEAVASKGMKLADLSDGDFVTKAKYDDHETKLKKLQSDYDALKANPSDSEQYKALEKERDDWKTKYDEQHSHIVTESRKASLANLKVKPVFQDFLLTEIGKNVTDAVDFETAAKKFVAENKQYLETEGGRPSGLPFTGGKEGADGLWSDLDKAIRS